MFYQSIKHKKSISRVKEALAVYYTVIKHSSHLRTLEKCRKHSPAARAFHISLVFSNACRVLSQCNTRLRLLYLLNKNMHLTVYLSVVFCSFKALISWFDIFPIQYCTSCIVLWDLILQALWVFVQAVKDGIIFSILFDFAMLLSASLQAKYTYIHVLYRHL